MVALQRYHVAPAIKSPIHVRAHQVEQHTQPDGAVHQQEAERAIGLPQRVLPPHLHLLATAVIRSVIMLKQQGVVRVIAAAVLVVALQRIALIQQGVSHPVGTGITADVGVHRNQGVEVAAIVYVIVVRRQPVAHRIVAVLLHQPVARERLIIKVRGVIHVITQPVLAGVPMMVRVALADV